jgi:hypothetical protein
LIKGAVCGIQTKMMTKKYVGYIRLRRIKGQIKVISMDECIALHVCFTIKFRGGFRPEFYTKIQNVNSISKSEAHYDISTDRCGQSVF